MGDRRVHGSLLIRAPRPADAEGVLAVIVARDVADLGAPDFTLDDLLEEWDEPGFSLADDAWLAERGEIAAYAALRGKDQLVLVAPRHCGNGLGSGLLDLVELRALELGRPLRQHLPQRNASAAALLSSRGYRRVHSYWRMQIDLSRPPPAPAWPVGVTVRPFRQRGRAAGARASRTGLLGGDGQPAAVARAVAAKRCGTVDLRSHAVHGRRARRRNRGDGSQRAVGGGRRRRGAAAGNRRRRPRHRPRPRPAAGRSGRVPTAAGCRPPCSTSRATTSGRCDCTRASACASSGGRIAGAPAGPKRRRRPRTPRGDGLQGRR